MSQLTLATTNNNEDRNVSLHRVPREVRKAAESLESNFQRIGNGQKIRPALKALQGRCNVPCETLKRLFYKWQRIGIAALIDHRKCRGCGLPGCTAERALTLPTETLDHWRAGCIGNDKRGMRESWETRIIGALRAGKEVPGIGTWKQLFATMHPFAQMPTACPWHIHNAPRGLSLSNFRRFKLPKSVELLGKKGQFAMWSELPEVRIDLTQLEVLRWIVFDDHRIDAYCVVEDGRGGFQTVEMWGVFAMDVATRRVLAFGLRPRINRDDGKAMGITRADVQHLIAHIFARYGMPMDYDMTLIVENAAAAITTETETMLARVSGGRIKVKRSGMHSSDALISGFPDRWGNFRGKAWLESWFNPFDIAMGCVKGQMGSDYWAKPGRTDSQRRVAERMTAIMPHLTDEQREKLTLPFEWAGDMHQLVKAAVDAVDARTDHDCVGFTPVRFFRWDALTDHAPKPLDYALADVHGTRRELELFAQSPAELQNLWLSYGHTRVESPMEKFERLYQGGRRFMRVAEETYLHLMLNESARGKAGEPLTYKGGDVLDVEVKQGTRKALVRFTGKTHELSLGQEVRVAYMSDNLEAGIFIVDEHGRQLGRMAHSADPTHDDVEGLQRSMGVQLKAYGEVQTHLRKTLLKPAVMREQIAQIETNLSVLNTLREGVGAATTAPALPESSELVRAVMSTKPRPSRTGILKASEMAFAGASEEDES